MVIPHAHSEHHAVLEGSTHTLESALGSKLVGVAEGGLLLSTEVVGDGVGGGDTSNVGLGVLDDFAVLDVDATDLREVTGGGAVGGDELGHDGDLGLGVDGLAGAEE